MPVGITNRYDSKAKKVVWPQHALVPPLACLHYRVPSLHLLHKLTSNSTTKRSKQHFTNWRNISTWPSQVESRDTYIYPHINMAITRKNIQLIIHNTWVRFTNSGFEKKSVTSFRHLNWRRPHVPRLASCTGWRVLCLARLARVVPSGSACWRPCYPSAFVVCTGWPRTPLVGGQVALNFLWPWALSGRVEWRRKEWMGMYDSGGV